MIEAEFLKFSADKLTQMSGRVQDCLGRLTNDQIWMRNTENENSIGNLVLQPVRQHGPVDRLRRRGKTGHAPARCGIRGAR